MKKCVRIVYSSFLDEDTKKVQVGGIQTYILNLSSLIRDMGIDVVVYQKSNTTDFEYILDNGTKVKGKYFVKKKTMYHTVRKLSEYCLSEANPEDIIVFGNETYALPSEIYSIVLQHGIAWDIPEKTHFNTTLNHLYVAKRALKAYKLTTRFKGVNKVVCVDYNFVNSYRTQVAYQDVEFDVVPNFSDVPEYKPRDPNNEEIKIIFARRFFTYRGTRIFAEAVEKLLEKYDNIQVLIAGSGPDEKYLRDKFIDNNKVKISAFETTDSIKMHSEYDIAVVPTVGSEGTSLSLLEAMASGCAAIATNVGGMTNIILNEYNGLMINPTADEIFKAIEKLIINPELREKISKNGYETVKNAFSKERWLNKWREIIENI